MRPNTSWFIQNRVIHQVCAGEMSLEDVSHGSTSIIEHIDESDAPLVHLIISETDLISLPTSLAAFTKSVEFLRHKRLGWFIIYGNMNQAPIVKFLGTAVITMAGVRHRRVETLRDALKHLAFVDTTLPSAEDMLNIRPASTGNE